MSMMIQSGRFAAAVASLTVVSSGTVVSTGSTSTFTPGSTATGDLLILICGGTNPTVSGGSASWTYNNQTGGGTNIKTCYKFLAAGDVGATHTISTTTNAAPFAWVVYRGPTVMTLKESVAQASGSTLDFVGYTPGAQVAALVIGFSHGGGSTASIAFPGGWTVDTYIDNFSRKAAYTSPTYTGGALSITGVADAICGTLWELT